MNSEQIDRVCQDWLQEYYGEAMANEYRTYSLVIPVWNSVALNDALEALRLALCAAFGPEQSFRNTDYYEARAKLGLPDDRTAIPDVFLRAFAMSI